MPTVASSTRNATRIASAIAIFLMRCGDGPTPTESAAEWPCEWPCPAPICPVPSQVLLRAYAYIRIHTMSCSVSGKRQRSVIRLVRRVRHSGRQSGDRRDALHACYLQEVDDKRSNLGKHHRRSEEHTSELQSLMRNSYAVF